MHTYLGLLRGINVGGNSLIKMADLKDALTTSGLTNVRTYIQSGNIIFDSPSQDKQALTKQIEKTITSSFSFIVPLVLFSIQEWADIIADAPTWWGNDKTRKHTILVLIPPYDMQRVIASIGELRPNIEDMQPGDGVLYQSMSMELFGRTTTGKIASNPVYKKMTVRNYNTATKLLSLLNL
jgi:uncharacterized protein (DUF1697 family)